MAQQNAAPRILPPRRVGISPNVEEIAVADAAVADTAVADAVGSAGGSASRDSISTAVAGAAVAVEVGDAGGDASQTDDSSIAGDTIASDASAAESEGEGKQKGRGRPKEPFQGESRSRGESSKWNKEPEVGNFGLFFGNWGRRSTLAGPAAARERRDISDRQILKCPAQVLILCEATREVGGLLQQSAMAAVAGERGLAGRSTHEHYVVQGSEESGVLVAARKDNTLFLECLDYEVHDDHTYKEKGKLKQARSREMVCKIGFKQNIGHLGTEIVVCGVHGHNRTMKFEWPQVLRELWDRLAMKIRSYGIRFLAGDFNMSLTEVPRQLRSRGIELDCIAWYPWRHLETTVHQQPLGFDSCAIFYIGGSVQVSMPWSLWQVDHLTAVAEEIQAKTAEWPLDEYGGLNHPGQHWGAYRSKAIKESDQDKNLKQRLQDLLTPSTSDYELQLMPRRQFYCPYLRIKQKQMDKAEWRVGEDIHNGAHFPLCVFTNNARARSMEKAMARSSRRGKGKGKGKGQGQGQGTG